MEEEDGFVRTIGDDADNLYLSGEDSCLEFGSDADKNEDAESPTMLKDSGDSVNPDPSFFSVSAPNAWSFQEARREAAALRPFQTSVDEKIRRARASLNPAAAAPNKAGEESGTQVHGHENENNRSSKADEHSESDDSLSEPEGELDFEETKINVSANAAPEMKKGKKRLRKEAKAASVTFAQLHLSRPLLKAVERLEWSSPTPVQARAIPYILAGRDVCGSAVTGSGKTAAFVLPILERLLRSGMDNSTHVIILLPTRELAAQCHAVISTLAKHTSIRAALSVGGLSNTAQEIALRSRPHIIVATPGRLIDHVRNAHGFTLDDVEILVMDEADRLLEMGFKDEIEEIIRFTPSVGRQTLLFSATMNSKLRSLIKLSLQNPVALAVDPIHDVASTLGQEFVKLKPNHEQDKDACLFAVVSSVFTKRTIVFFRQKVTAHLFKILFGLSKLKCAELHGNLTQAQRLEALDSFRERDVDFLLCTDLAARGLDIAGVETVINYDMPSDMTEYVHRVGRTARAGASGRSCSIVCSSSNEERKLLRLISQRAQNVLSARVVQPATLGKWRARIDALKDAVQAVLREERAEKELRKAEMEVEKAGNLIKHSDRIHSRPARTWFQSTKEKENTQETARAARGLAPSARALEKNRKSDQKKRKSEIQREEQMAERRKQRDRDYAKQRSDKAKIRKTRRHR